MTLSKKDDRMACLLLPKKNQQDQRTTRPFPSRGSSELPSFRPPPRPSSPNTLRANKRKNNHGHTRGGQTFFVESITRDHEVGDTWKKSNTKLGVLFPLLLPAQTSQKDGNSHSSNSRATLKAKTPKALYMTGKSAVLKKKTGPRP